MTPWQIGRIVLLTGIFSSLCYITYKHPILKIHFKMPRTNLIKTKFRTTDFSGTAFYADTTEKAITNEAISNLSSIHYTDPLVDKRKRNFSQLLSEAMKVVENFPPQSQMTDGQAFSYNKSCAVFPNLFSIKFDQNWQIMSSQNGTAYIYGAYLDDRNTKSNSNTTIFPIVRILGMMETNMRADNSTIYQCQLWFEGQKQPIFSPVNVNNLLVTDKKFFWQHLPYYKDSRHQIFLFACNSFKLDNKLPASVSIVLNSCDNATNNLKIVYDKPKVTKNFAVCVKGLDFFHEDHSVRLVEWIELLNILGADKIFLYNLAEHPNASKVLKYYENTDYVEVTQLTLPGGLPNDPRLRNIYLEKRLADKRANEMIPYNDCLYRNMYKYKYLAMLDPDETIIPLMDFNWDNLLNRLKAQNLDDFDSFSAICFRNTYFFSVFMKNWTLFQDIPSFMHQLQHVYRSHNYTEDSFGTKCFHVSRRVIMSHNHFPVYCNGICKTLFVDTDVAHLQHYKGDCPLYLRNCTNNFKRNPVLDYNVWRYKDNLINRTVSILKILGFIKELN